MGLNSIKLIVGLGNPDKTYENTRHNVGFWFLDELAKRHSIKFVHTSQVQGLVSKSYLFGGTVHLLKPTTYMNHSGRSVSFFTRYYKVLPRHMLVVHDEVDFDVGVIRFKKDGGHGGHNGVRDIIACLNLREFCRLRIGIGRPGSSEQVSRYVLAKPPVHEEISISEGISKAIDRLPELLQGDYQSFMNSMHGV